MRLSVDGFLNANNSGNRNHRRQSLPLPVSLSFTPVFPSLRDTARALFYKPGVEIERVGVSISRRLLIHDYRPPRYSLPECKMATSPDRHFVAWRVLFFLLFFSLPRFFKINYSPFRSFRAFALPIITRIRFYFSLSDKIPKLRDLI